MPQRTVVIRTFSNEFEAQVAQARLESAEIPSILLRDDAGGLHPALLFVHGVRLAVRRSDAAAALRLLDDPTAEPEEELDPEDEPDTEEWTGDADPDRPWE